MTLEEASEWILSSGSRSKKLDPYRDWIISWLKEHPDLSSAQVEDWLKERFPTIDVAGSTVRAYVSEIRDIYHIPKVVRILHMKLWRNYQWGNRCRWIGEKPP
jgi:hypothetical protein